MKPEITQHRAQFLTISKQNRVRQKLKKLRNIIFGCVIAFGLVAFPHFAQGRDIDESAVLSPSSTKENRRIAALLLPLRSSRSEVRKVARTLFEAAQLALFDINVPELTLIIKDTGGTPSGALSAARAARADGAEFIIGPLFGKNTAQLADFVAIEKIPIVSFSNDRAVARPWIWVFGYLPEESVERIIIEAVLQGITRFGALIPQNQLGIRLAPYLATVIARYGGELSAQETYTANAKEMAEPVARFARYAQRRAAHAAELDRLIRQARAVVPRNLADASEADIFADLQVRAPTLAAKYSALKQSETLGEIPYDAVVMLEGGLAVRNLAPLLPYFDIDPRFTKFLGLSLWDDPQLSAEPPLRGGWYASAAPRGREAFAKRFEEIYKHPPVQIASLAYDAVSLFAALIRLNSLKSFSRAVLTDVNGFQGIDGIFRLTEGGLNERGQAVLEITARGKRVITPAPNDFVEYERRKAAALALAQSRARKTNPQSARQ